MQLLFHPDEDDSDDYNLKCGVEDIQWSVEVVLTTGMSSKCSRDIAQCSATQWPILHVPSCCHTEYTLCGNTMVQYGWLCFGMVWYQMVYYGWVNMMVYSYSICELWYGRVWVGQDDGMCERSLWQHHKQLSTQGRLLNDGHN